MRHRFRAVAAVASVLAVAAVVVLVRRLRLATARLDEAILLGRSEAVLVKLDGAIGIVDAEIGEELVDLHRVSPYRCPRICIRRRLWSWTKLTAAQRSIGTWCGNAGAIWR